MAPTTGKPASTRKQASRFSHAHLGRTDSIANAVQFAYDDFGQLITEYQEHGGAVNTSTSLKVGYTYANGSSNTIRLAKMTYPGGRELNYGYGSAGATDDALSRVVSLIDNDGTTHLVDYSYLGGGSFTETDYAAIDVKNTLVGTAGGNDPDTGDIYRGLDRFGSVKDCYWYDYGSSADVLRIKHGHDRAGNRLYREEADTSDLDQLYGYDDVNRLTQSAEGTLSGTKDSISSLNFKHQWSLDATGNWSGFKEDDDGDSTWDLEQTRTSNAVNEITDVTETAGPSWLTPAYNRAGNMTTIPQPGDPTQSYTATYDAWNRLVKLEDGANTVAEYTFDGAKRLVVRKKYVSGSLNQTRHFYHTAQWQTIEERLETGGTISSTADRQFTWGLRYIDDLVCRTVNSTHDYAYQDANWNVVLSSSGLSRVGYAAYGQVRSTCAAASGDLDNWEHYFAGYRRDEDTGLYLVRHRVYQPELGCWVQRDPIGFESGDINFYAYAHSSSPNRIDPSGLIAWGTLMSWAGPALLVRLAVVSAGAAAGYVTAQDNDVEQGFQELAWGGVLGQSVLTEFNAHWNDKGIGDGVKGMHNGKRECRGVSGSGRFTYARSVGAWADSDFALSIDVAGDGCDVTKLRLRRTMCHNIMRMQALKVIIESVEVTDEGYAEPCCTCKPKCVGTQVALQMMARGLLFDDRFSLNLKFIFCADGSTFQLLADYDTGVWQVVWEK